MELTDASEVEHTVAQGTALMLPEVGDLHLWGMVSPKPAQLPPQRWQWGHPGTCLEAGEALRMARGPRLTGSQFGFRAAFPTRGWEASLDPRAGLRSRVGPVGQA